MMLLMPMLTMYKLKLITNHKAKQLLLSCFFKGMDEQEFKRTAKEFSLTQTDLMVRPEAIKKIKWHKERGDRVVVVSASVDCWVKPWCDRHGLELIATKLEFGQNRLTGKFATPNCYGPEKVRRIKEKFDLADFDEVYAYGDSRGDHDMLKIAHIKFYKPFH